MVIIVSFRSETNSKKSIALSDMMSKFLLTNEPNKLPNDHVFIQKITVF